jgi:uncharacterized membrane protein
MRAWERPGRAAAVTLALAGGTLALLWPVAVDLPGPLQVAMLVALGLPLVVVLGSAAREAAWRARRARAARQAQEPLGEDLQEVPPVVRDLRPARRGRAGRRARAAGR